jgi:RHH-type proline utilization regulon transcriptional repressor/proline dehydrogenase/delta 1-pyrroline-5-carboxylate dehydrogenase
MTINITEEYNTELLHISKHAFADERELIKSLLPEIQFDFRLREVIQSRSLNLISKIRNSKERGMEHFLQKFNLNSEQGIAILSLAEALLRIPDDDTAKRLIIDKLANRKWVKHLLDYQALDLYLISIGLFISGKFAELNKAKNVVAKTIVKVGNPTFIAALKYSIKILSEQFIIGENIKEGIKNSKQYLEKGYRFSYDLLGESARTEAQAVKYYNQYLTAIETIKEQYTQKENKTVQQNIDWYNMPSLSVKLTSLTSRLEYLKLEEIEQTLLPKVIKLAIKCHEAGIALTFDAEEARRLDIYLHILTKLVLAPELKDYSFIGFVVQAYQKRAIKVVEYIVKLAAESGKKIPVRLVKGAYWDSEIKYAQEHGLIDYPVFTRKEFTDVSYLACAKKLLENNDYIYPQFATHNATTAASIIELAAGKDFEFQKLKGMGNALHDVLIKTKKVRIYAPVGETEELLSYLLRRILENGANTSFVSQVSNIKVKSESLVDHLFDKATKLLQDNLPIIKPAFIYPQRENSMGYDLGNKVNIQELNTQIAPYLDKQYKASSIINGKEIFVAKKLQEAFRPGKPAEKIGEISYATESEMQEAITVASNNFLEWSLLPVSERADILRRVAQTLNANKYELFSLLIREGGKSINDAIGEVREAIDFCRYYATMAESIMSEKTLPGPTGELDLLTMHGRGVFLCISPWNFPLAIFTGQIVAALVSGNTVVAKPANQTSIIATVIVQLMHRAGVPKGVLNLILASGSQVGKYVISDERINGVAFTGSNETAKNIYQTLASRQGAIAPLIAETGGQNAMIVDSSALLEQVTDDVIASAFHSAGQRCSALRVLYIQEEIYEPLIQLITGALDSLKLADTTDLSADIGPVIDKNSLENLNDHINQMTEKGFKLIAHHSHKGHLTEGYFFYPHIIEINSINDIEDEKFGPILHVIKYRTKDLDKVINEINNYGFGLTFGVHSRIEERVAYIRSKIKVGNIYINRTMIGAQVESHPFGGEGKSGTGFKAGGPHYLLRFMTERTTSINLTAIGGNIELLSS